MISASVADTTSVEAAKELPDRGIKNLSLEIGEKQFPGIFLAASAAIVEIPADLK